MVAAVGCTACPGCWLALAGAGVCPATECGSGCGWEALDEREKTAGRVMRADSFCAVTLLLSSQSSRARSPVLRLQGLVMSIAPSTKRRTLAEAYAEAHSEGGRRPAVGDQRQATTAHGESPPLLAGCAADRGACPAVTVVRLFLPAAKQPLAVLRSPVLATAVANA